MLNEKWLFYISAILECMNCHTLKMDEVVKTCDRLRNTPLFGKYLYTSLVQL